MLTWIPSVMQIGPLTLPTEWLAWIAGLALGLWVLRGMINRAGHDGKGVANVFAESFLYGVLAAFLSPVVLDLPNVLSQPFTTLMGGFSTGAYWVGGAVGVVSLLIKFRSVRIPFRVLGDSVAAACLTVWLVYSLLVEQYGSKMEWMTGKEWFHPIHLYQVVLLAVGLWLVSQNIRTKSPGAGAAIGLLWAGWILLLISNFQPPEPSVDLLTTSQWTGVWFSILGLIWRVTLRPSGVERT